MYTIDFSINGLSTEIRLRSQRTPTPCKIKVNNCKLIDLVIRIELTRAILVPRFSYFLRNTTIHIRTFLYLEICFLSIAYSNEDLNVSLCIECSGVTLSTNVVAERNCGVILTPSRVTLSDSEWSQSEWLYKSLVKPLCYHWCRQHSRFVRFCKGTALHKRECYLCPYKMLRYISVNVTQHYKAWMLPASGVITERSRQYRQTKILLRRKQIECCISISNIYTPFNSWKISVILLVSFDWKILPP